MIAPDSSVPSSTPSCVTIGSHALRSPCPSDTRTAVSPFARAVRMKSASSTSSIAARVSRMIFAVEKKPSVAAGSTRLRQSPIPLAGVQPSRTANSRISIRPIQYVGALCPISAITRAV